MTRGIGQQPFLSHYRDKTLSLSYTHDVQAFPVRSNSSLPHREWPLVYFHEAKTGGSSMRYNLYHAALRHRLPSFIPCYLSKFAVRSWQIHNIGEGGGLVGCMVTMWNDGLREAANGTRSNLWEMWRDAAIIGGCYDWDVLPLLLIYRVGFSCIRLVRHPIERMVSFYYERIYLRQTRKRISQLKPHEIHRVFHQSPGSINSTLDGLCGKSPCSLSTAIQRLQTSCLVGLSDRRHETCELFNARMPWLRMNCSTHLNTGRPHERRQNLPPAVLAALESLAAPTDLPLYQVAVEMFEQYKNGKAWPSAWAAWTDAVTGEVSLPTGKMRVPLARPVPASTTQPSVRVQT